MGSDFVSGTPAAINKSVQRIDLLPVDASIFSCDCIISLYVRLEFCKLDPNPDPRIVKCA